MKKIILLVLSLLLAWNFSAYALDTTLLDVRNEIFKNGQDLKEFFATSRDPLLLNSLWDSSVTVVSQLDAYFSMLGIFNAVKNENLNDEAFSYLIAWLNRIKESADLNIQSLDGIKTTTDARSKMFVSKFKASFNNLRDGVPKELQVVYKLKDAVKKK
jgi:hypothetical protein